jgi:CrcB protein
MNPLIIVAVLVAGSLGALLRYVATLLFPAHPQRFPWAIFAVNVVGSFLAGLFAAYGNSLIITPDVAFVMISGFCGGLTTMSTFAVDSVARIRLGNLRMAGINVVGTMTASLLAATLGLAAGGLSIF